MTDPNDQMERLVRKLTDDGEYIASVVAHKLVDNLEATNPGFLNAWLEHNQRAFLSQFVARLSNTERAVSRAQMERRRFTLAADVFESTGDSRLLSQFQVEYTVNSDNVRRQVKNMTADDCAFVKRRYRAARETAALEEAFFEAVEQKLRESGMATIGDLFSEERFIELHESIVG